MSGDPVRIRVLCVDDHPIVLKGVAGLVDVQSDMEVVAEATTGREAIEQFRAHRPDITLMDLQMPELSGLDAIVAIRGEFPEARIIVLTTYAGDVAGAACDQGRARVRTCSRMRCTRSCSTPSGQFTPARRRSRRRCRSSSPSMPPTTPSRLPRCASCA